MMTHRESTLLWMRDLLEQLSSCRQQLEWSKDPQAVRALSDALVRDLDRCMRLAEKLRAHSSRPTESVTTF